MSDAMLQAALDKLFEAFDEAPDTDFASMSQEQLTRIAEAAVFTAHMFLRHQVAQRVFLEDHSEPQGAKRLPAAVSAQLRADIERSRHNAMRLDKLAKLVPASLLGYFNENNGMKSRAHRKYRRET